MQEMIVPSLSVQLGRDYLPHDGPKRNRPSKLGYHVYFIPKDIQQKDMIAFAHKDSFTAVANLPASKMDSTAA